MYKINNKHKFVTSDAIGLKTHWDIQNTQTVHSYALTLQSSTFLQHYSTKSTIFIETFAYLLTFCEKMNIMS